MRPRLLDLFCGAGGAGEGYHRAGFDVTGVDLARQPNYPHAFVQADALEYLREHGGEFDVIHASPPCQAYSTITPDQSRHPRLIAPVRDLLIASGKPYVIENVAGARRELVEPMMLCGSSFGLNVRRHRFFESSEWLMSIPCDHESQPAMVGVYGDHGYDGHLYRASDGSKRGRRAADVHAAREAMGMGWGTWREVAEAIPPAYTEFIGAQLLRALIAV